MQTSKKKSEPAQIRASDIYSRQNKIIHKSFISLGLPYDENKRYWIDFLNDNICARTVVTGLSDTTLTERRELIRYLKKQNVVFSNPFVPNNTADWKTGDPDIFVTVQKFVKRGFPGRPSAKYFTDSDKGKMLKKIEALLAEAKRPWAYAHSMAKKMARVDRIEWCPPKQMHKIISAMMIDAVRHGRKVKQEVS